MPKDPAEALPGGAPVKARRKSSRPCKYGPRDADGFCPKKPKAPKKARKPKAKRPCKYGPRDADGFCPKKPRKGTELATAVVNVASPRSTPEQKKAGRKKLTSAVAKAAEIGVGKAVDQTFTEVNKLRKTKQGRALIAQAKAEAKALAKKAAKATVIGAVLTGATIKSSQAKANLREREVTRRVASDIRRTEARIKRSLTQPERAALVRQLTPFYRKEVDREMESNLG